jgi:palmitoyl transferase
MFPFALRICLLSLLLFPLDFASASTSLPAWALSARHRAQQIWTEGGTDLYLSGYTWHNRASYSSEKIRRYNERAWGGGLGKSIYDEDGDWQGLYALGFLDSHSRLQMMAGYGFQKIWRASEDTRLGLGYTVFLTSRSNVLGGLPVPGILPLASLGFKNANLYAAYVPPYRKGSGNVLFLFTKWEF